MISLLAVLGSAIEAADSYRESPAAADRLAGSEWSTRMDLLKIINDLRQEREKLDAIIHSLAQLQDSGPPPPLNPASRRGRRSMDAAGRLEVSQRMKKYWDERRKQEAGRNGSAPEGLAKSVSA